MTATYTTLGDTTPMFAQLANIGSNPVANSQLRKRKSGKSWFGNRNKRSSASEPQRELQVPQVLKDFCEKVVYKVQDPSSQLGALFGDSSKTTCFQFPSITLPTEKNLFNRLETRSKLIATPSFLEIHDQRFEVDHSTSPCEGGFGTITFFKRSTASSQSSLPETIALKSCAVPAKEVLTFLQTPVSQRWKLGFQWVTQFAVQERLHRHFILEKGLKDSQLPFLKNFGACITFIGGKFFAHFAMEKGDTDFLDFANEMPSALQTFPFLTSMAYSLHQINSVGLIYGDMKLENVMLTPTGCKLFDFDGSVFIEEKKYCSIGTPGYMSPQRKRRGHDKFVRFSQLADERFALGTSLLIALTGRDTPFQSCSAAYIKSFDLKGYMDKTLPYELPSLVRNGVARIISGLMAYEEKDRMTALEAAVTLKKLETYLNL